MARCHIDRKDSCGHIDAAMAGTAILLIDSADFIRLLTEYPAEVLGRRSLKSILEFAGKMRRAFKADLCCRLSGAQAASQHQDTCFVEAHVA